MKVCQSGIFKWALYKMIIIFLFKYVVGQAHALLGNTIWYFKTRYINLPLRKY